MNDFYMTDPADPDAPVKLGEYLGIRPGDNVVYENPAWRQPDGTYKTGGMDPPLVVDAIYQFRAGAQVVMTQAILNGGEWEVGALNLRRVAQPGEIRVFPPGCNYDGTKAPGGHRGDAGCLHHYPPGRNLAAEGCHCPCWLDSGGWHLIEANPACTSRAHLAEEGTSR